MAWTIITIVRMAVLGIATLFSFVTIALAGHMHSQTFLKYDFENLSIAVAVLTIISTPQFFVVGFLRKGSFLTMNVVEAPVLGFLSILWLANGILYTEWEAYSLGNTQCNSNFLNAADQTFCGEFRAVEGLSFITWLCLMGYAIGTVVLCLIGKSRGNDVWLVGADDADYFTWKKNPNQGGSFVQPQIQFTGQQPQMQMGYGQLQKAQFQQASVQGQMMYPPSHAAPMGTMQV